MHPSKARHSGNGITNLRVVLHGAGAKWICAQVDRELPVAQPRDMGNEISLGDLSERNRCFGQKVLTKEVFGRPLRDAGCAQLIRTSPRLAEFKNSGLCISAHQWSRRSLSTCGWAQ